ncbi:MAG: hypothetical protein S4CHLAM123_03140 [Chlamydiales bacterium]|nr:hypothetical protein [Chlamydiales bacterium]
MTKKRWERTKTKKQITEAILGNKTKGKYLHLHGSYLFSEESPGEFIKRNATYVFQKNDIEKMPIILCNQEEKLKRVKYYDILNWYSTVFNNSLDTTKQLFLFGYGGKDKYINKIIREKTQKNEGLKVKIIQRCPNKNENNQDKRNKINFWKGGEQLNLENLNIASSESELLNADSHTIFFVNSLSEFSWFQN